MPFRFMDLPPELRLLVYEELVLVGKVFYTPDWYDIEQGSRFKGHEDYRKPSLSVLRVSKAVNKEAEDVYLGGNLFVLPPISQEYLWPYSEISRANDMRKPLPVSKTAVPRIKSISIALCLRLSSAPLIMGRDEWDDLGNNYNPNTFDSMTPAQRLDHGHNMVLEWAFAARERLSIFIGRFKSLQSLELDFTNAYCPMGCCRLLDMNWKETTKNAKKICIIGLRNGEELTTVLAEWGDYFGVTVDELKHMYDIKT